MEKGSGKKQQESWCEWMRGGVQQNMEKNWWVVDGGGLINGREWMEEGRWGEK
jgi:hypothetical protein